MEELSTFHEFKYQKVVLFTLAKADQLDDVGMIGTTHDLNLFEDVGTLEWKEGKACQLH